jgi:hypothetical protein
VRSVVIALLAFSAGALTLFVFPGLAYVSFAMYGIPGSVFLLAAYGIWLVLGRHWPVFGNVFIIAVGAPVMFVLIPLLFVAPLVFAYIVGPTLVAEAVRRRSSKARAV